MIQGNGAPRTGHRMTRMAIPPGSACTVLFADVAGSTALYEVLGDERAFPLVEAALRAMAGCTAAAGGRVVKTIGDAVMAVFPAPDAAAGAAAAMQRGVAAMGHEAGVRLTLRIGFHHGELLARADGDVFGDTVNLASRLCDLASSGQVVTTQAVAHLLGPLHAAQLRPLYAVPVKGKAEEVTLVELAWRGDDGEQHTLIGGVAPPAAPARLQLRFDGRQLDMGPDRRKVSIGRDLEADFTVRDRSASRAHATLERRRDHFVLVDHSANGTWVSFDGRPEMHLHHEDLRLVGHGFISFGQPRAEAAQAVEFRAST